MAQCALDRNFKCLLIDGRWAYKPEANSHRFLRCLCDKCGDRAVPGAGNREGEDNRLKRGATVQVMVYPRPETKAVLVKAARNHDQTLSSFLILARPGEDRRARGMHRRGLVPEHELRQYV